jgi:hypothetical protein
MPLKHLKNYENMCLFLKTQINLYLLFCLLKNLMMKKRPKWSFVKSIPAAAARSGSRRGVRSVWRSA